MEDWQRLPSKITPLHIFNLPLNSIHYQFLHTFKEISETEAFPLSDIGAEHHQTVGLFRSFIFKKRNSYIVAYS